MDKAGVEEIVGQTLLSGRGRLTGDLLNSGMVV